MRGRFKTTETRRATERVLFVEERARGIDRLRRRGKRKVTVHLFLAPSNHGRFRIFAQPEGGALFAAMSHAGDSIGRVRPKDSMADIVLMVRKAINGREVVPCA